MLSERLREVRDTRLEMSSGRDLITLNFRSRKVSELSAVIVWGSSESRFRSSRRNLSRSKNYGNVALRM